MSFTVVITEIDEREMERERYKQTVEELDLLALINTINRKKRKPREKKAKVQL